MLAKGYSAKRHHSLLETTVDAGSESRSNAMLCATTLLKKPIVTNNNRL
ncbi:MAG: hypothetical protein ACK45R_11295 [Candidatus Kapaibacterium sp.]